MSPPQTTTPSPSPTGGRGPLNIRSLGLLAVLVSAVLSILNLASLEGPRHSFLPTTTTDQQRELPASHGAAASAGGPASVGPDIFRTKATPMPGIRLSPEEEKAQGINRNIYGGKGDKAHLGGFTEIDMHGISPHLWTAMVRYIGVKSLVDLGCGKGISTSWFHYHGVNVTCVEGSHDAIEQTLLPHPETQIVEHDFTRGPYWPDETVDAVWCVEFAEHVQRQYIPNYLPIFRKAAFIFVTHSNWGGWHHAEVHTDQWWRVKYMSMIPGLLYSQDLTDLVRKKAAEEMGWHKVAPNGEKYNAQHVRLSMQVFINPQVASLERHQHLMAEFGCYLGKGEGEGYGHYRTYPCGEPNPDNGKVDKLIGKMPDRFYPLVLTKEQDERWEMAVFGKTSEGAVDDAAGRARGR